jgi:hypothetical protein
VRSASNASGMTAQEKSPAIAAGLFDLGVEKVVGRD